MLVLVLVLKEREREREMYKKERYRIEPFRHRVDLEPDYKEKTWALLESSMLAIFDHNPSKLSFEELYRSAYNMVLHKFGNYLYDNVVRTISAHLEKVGKEVEGKSGEAFLQALVHCWSDYTRAMQNIRDILMYMNKTFVKQHSKAPVHELGLELWNKHLLQRPLVQSMLRQVVLAAILKFRKGDKTGNKLISQVTKMAMDIGPAVYETLVEEPIQQDTESFYRTVSQQAITSESCPSYLRLVQSSLEEESRMVDIYLFKTSKAKIVSKVEQEMIAKQVDILINMESSGLLHQLKSRHLENLELMYATLRRASNGHPSMIGLLKEHMTETGYKIIRQKVGGVADSIQVVRQLIEERALCDRILSGSFHADKSFSNGIQSCFEQVLNSNPATPEYLSVFLDSNLKKDLKGKSDEEVELVIDKVMTLFRYLNEKDVFEKYYKQHLAKRLLSGGKGGSSLALGMEEHEKTIILKLKTECGYQFTSKLESMFNDIRTSQDIMANFTSSSSGGGGSSSGGRGGSATGGIELSVQVLTTGSWPTQQAVQCQVPKELQACCNAFEQFYLKTHSGRKLSWMTNMGHGEVRALFGEGERKHELCVTTIQMCVRMMFNDEGVDEVPYKRMRKELFNDNLGNGESEGELKRCLQSLACVKGKNVLCKSPVGKEVGEDDVFRWNEEFRSGKYRVKIPVISSSTAGAVGGAGGSPSSLRKKIDEDRKPQIEAAIVRVMKSRRVLGHNEVVTEVTKMLSGRFLPSPAMIKQRIESLIEREFLERDAEERRRYKYVS